MELCVSNIAWSPADDPLAHSLLVAEGVSLLELAPTRLWPDLSSVSSGYASALLSDLAFAGLSPYAFQALLYGRPDLGLFHPAAREACLDYLKLVVQLAARLGVTVLVFGSPKNRVRGELHSKAAFTIATEFFHSLGSHANQMGVQVCLEPNPPCYGCDFITNMNEAAALVRAVNSSGFRLHGDAGELSLNNEDVEAVLGEHGA